MSTTTSAPELVAKIDGYSASLWRAFCAGLPAAEFHDEADVTWFVTGSTEAPWHNQVLLANFAPGAADRRVDELLAVYRDRRLPMMWQVSSARSPELPSLLHARGLTPGATLTGMAMDLDRLADSVPTPAGLEIERVADAAGLERWRRAYVAAFEMRDEEAGPLCHFYATVGFGDGAPFRHYVGSLAGELIASSTASFHSDGTAGLWHVGVVPALRRGGIGTAMSFAPMRNARERDCGLAVLYASADGAAVYPHLGFREYSQLTSYVWEPPS